jgi:UDP-N-acetyl-D-mannosaminuronate dehydrogenase
LTEEMVLVVGLGKVGCALFELLKESERFTVYGFDVDRERMFAVQQTEIPKEVDTVHVCIPFFGRDRFVNAVTEYLMRSKPRLVIAR